INGSGFRRRRQQPSAPVYGNPNLGGANLPSAYNYPSNTNFYGNNLNSQATKDVYGNPMMVPNAGNSM
ncbi:unnamed protein product, partial [Rotaria magnacalcarata]